VRVRAARRTRRRRAWGRGHRRGAASHRAGAGQSLVESRAEATRTRWQHVGGVQRSAYGARAERVRSACEACKDVHTHRGSSLQRRVAAEPARPRPSAQCLQERRRLAYASASCPRARARLHDEYQYHAARPGLERLRGSASLSLVCRVGAAAWLRITIAGVPGWSGCVAPHHHRWCAGLERLRGSASLSLVCRVGAAAWVRITIAGVPGWSRCEDTLRASPPIASDRSGGRSCSSASGSCASQRS
jgi:hypothetical protein